jgi:hypothetical protein
MVKLACHRLWTPHLRTLAPKEVLDKKLEVLKKTEEKEQSRA